MCTILLPVVFSKGNADILFFCSYENIMWQKFYPTLYKLMTCCSGHKKKNTMSCKVQCHRRTVGCSKRPEFFLWMLPPTPRVNDIRFKKRQATWVTKLLISGLAVCVLLRSRVNKWPFANHSKLSLVPNCFICWHCLRWCSFVNSHALVQYDLTFSRAPRFPYVYDSVCVKNSCKLVYTRALLESVASWFVFIARKRKDILNKHLQASVSV